MEEKINYFTLTRGSEDPKGSHKYDGVMYRNSFKVDKEIFLVGVSFFGLPSSAKADHGDFLIYLMVEEKGTTHSADNYKIKTIYPEKTFAKRVPKGKKINIFLEKPARINPGVWVDIGFQLEGPETATIKEADIDVLSKHAANGVVCFDLLRGSKQMPEIFFLLP